MRVIRSAAARIHREEDGAILFLVAATFLVLVGMLVLTFDLGRGVAFRREIVNGTDAAAIAAAQQCALGNGTLAAQDAATAVFLDNVSLRPAEITSIVMPECENPAGTADKTVTVTTRADIEYYFAPIFGFDSGDIATSATAMWSAAQINPVPIMVDQQQLLDCGIMWNQPPDPDAQPIECDLEYDKDTLENPSWGLLDLWNWNNPDAWLDPQNCSVDANTLMDIIANGGFTEPLELNGDPPGSAPTYTCVDNGLSDSVWSELETRTLIFPVIDVDTSVGYIIPPRSKPRNNTDRRCTGADIEALKAQRQDCLIHTVNVIGWIVLHITDTSNHGSTITVESVTDITTGGWVGEGHIDVGIRQVRLVD